MKWLFWILDTRQTILGQQWIQKSTKKLSFQGLKITYLFYRYVELPDGRVQRVRYRVDKYSGFVADVTYEHGKAPAPKYEPVPDYMPAHLPDDGPSKFNPFG